ncbi:MAG: hypothetical protein ACLRNQ_05820 [Flavonifractor plautii]
MKRLLTLSLAALLVCRSHRLRSGRGARRSGRQAGALPLPGGGDGGDCDPGL